MRGVTAPAPSALGTWPVKVRVRMVQAWRARRRMDVSDARHCDGVRAHEGSDGPSQSCRASRGVRNDIQLYFGIPGGQE